jgi:predicted Zn-ribbon and HTH transcriptional regulator
MYRIKPPCPKCPYTLGQVQFVRNPCPECKANNYEMYKTLIKGKGKQQFDKPSNE